MSRAHLIYPLEKRLNKELERISKDPHNAEILNRYYQVRKCQVAQATILNEMNRLRIMSEMFQKPFESGTKMDIERLCTEINDTRVAADTVNAYWKILRRLFQWMRGCTRRGEFPPEVSWIRLKNVPYARIRKEDLVPMDTVLHILEFAKHIRDKALFQCKLDAGCRIGEILTAKVGEVTFNKNGAEIKCDGKTGDDKPLILTWSTTTLAIWMNQHPFRDDPESPLWPQIHSNTAKQLSYGGALYAFKFCLKKSGTTKKIWPHLLKHISCSFDNELGLPESFRKYKHHWTEGSKMTQVYEHISPTLVPRIQKEQLELMKKYGYGLGMKPQDDEQNNPVQFHKQCHNCNFANPRDSKYCNNCAKLLVDGIENKDDPMILLQKILQDPKKLKKLASVLEAI